MPAPAPMTDGGRPFYNLPARKAHEWMASLINCHTFEASLISRHMNKTLISGCKPTLRPEQPADYRETENVTREAFWNHYAPGCCEHYLLHTLRNHPDFIKELDYVATDNGRIIGHIAYLAAHINGDNGQCYDVLTLGPVSVLPSCQGQGIGRCLIEHTREIAVRMGFRAILLCGDPMFYTRAGFMPAEQLGIRTADNLYRAALHVCELYPQALADARGRYIESPAYNFNAADAEAFDRSFPPKERISGTPSQQRFAEVLAMWHEAQETAQ